MTGDNGSPEIPGNNEKKGTSRGKGKGPKKGGAKQPESCDRCSRIGIPSCPKCRKSFPNGFPKREPGEDDSEAAVPTDKVGHAVPANLVAPFAVLSQFEEADAHVRALQKIIDEVARSPGGEQLARYTKPVGAEGKTIHKTEELQALHRHLRFTRPYSVCPWCKGKGNKTCKGCSGTGWVTKTTWDGAEKDVKEAIA